MDDTPSPVVIEQVIPSYDELPALVKDGLRIVATEQGFCDYQIECTSGSNLGDGYMGLIMKTMIHGTKFKADGEEDKDEVHELNVLCKIQHVSKVRREFCHSYEAFEREVRVYTEFLAEIVQLQREKGITEEEGFFNFPKCFFAKISPEEQEAVIIMEDLRDKGFSMANKFKPIPIETTEVIVTALAKLHAASFVLKDQKPDVYKAFTHWKCLFEKLMLQPASVQMFEQCLANAIKYVGENDKVNAKLTKLKDNIVDTFMWLVDDKNANGYAIVGHGKRSCFAKFFLNLSIPSRRFMDQQLYVSI